MQLWYCYVENLAILATEKEKGTAGINVHGPPNIPLTSSLINWESCFR